MRCLEESMLVNPFASDSSGSFEGKAQKIEKASCSEDPEINQVLDFYKDLASNAAFAEIANRIYQKGGLNKIYHLPILRPVQIEHVLQSIISSYPAKTVIAHTTGALIRNLMLDSYMDGNNDFTLTTGDLAITGFLQHLEGLESRTLRYTVNGASSRTNFLRFIDGTHNGHISHSSFEHCYSSRITVNGDLGHDAGYSSSWCTFNLRGRIGTHLGNRSNTCYYIISSDVGESPGYEAGHCVFMAQKKKTFEKLCRQVQSHRDNVVKLIAKDGTVIKEVKV